MHPLLEEFCRIAGRDACRPEVFRRLQREMRDIVQPLLDERDGLAQRVVELEADLARLRTTVTKGKGEPVKVPA